MKMSKLEELRKSIDNIDERMLELLKERVALVDDIYAAKKEEGIRESFDSDREVTLLKSLRKQAENRLSSAEVDAVFLQILSICRHRQKETHVCVFGEKNGWTEDAALQRFGNSSTINAVDTAEDFLAGIEHGNLGFACVTPQFSSDRAAILESLLSNKISIVEEFTFSPEFSVVSNSAKDLSEVHEICVTNEILRLLRPYFVSMSFDIKINICRSMSEAYENLQSINPVAAILPSNLVKSRNDLIVIKEKLKSELLGPVKFMVFTNKARLQVGSGKKTTILCALNGDSDKLWEMLAVVKAFNLKIYDIQTVDFEGKPWKKITSLEFSAPANQDELNHIIADLEKKCILVKLCGIYSEYL